MHLSHWKPFLLIIWHSLENIEHSANLLKINKMRAYSLSRYLYTRFWMLKESFSPSLRQILTCLPFFVLLSTGIRCVEWQNVNTIYIVTIPSTTTTQQQHKLNTMNGLDMKPHPTHPVTISRATTATKITTATATATTAITNNNNKKLSCFLC